MLKTRVMIGTIFLAAAFIFAVGNRSVLAQSPSKDAPSVDELREKVKQLEKTVEELKTQIGSIEDTQRKVNAEVISAKAPKVIQAVSDQPLTTSVPDKSSSGDSSANSAKTVKSDTSGDSSFEVYGFAMLDAGYQFKQNDPNWFDVIRPTKLPSFGGQFDPDGKFYMGVRQSRLGVKTSTPTKFGELKTIFEFELFGTGVDAGQTTFRLRHAYGELGQFGAGQYWTVFGDTDAYPNTFEYWGPNGLVWFRNVQFRWMPLKGKNSVTIGLEKPGAGADLGNYSDRIELQGVKPHLTWPDLTGHFRMDRDWGHIQISGILRSIKWKDTNTSDGVDLSGGSLGFGGSFSSHFNFTKNNIGRFQFTYGKGIENYMNDAPVDIGIHATTQVNPLGGTTASFEGVAIPVFGMSTFLDHTWNEKFTTSVGYSMLNMQNTNGEAADAFHQGQYGIVNLLYTPVKNVTIGGEFQWGRRNNFLDGFHADDFRIQFGFKYNFSKVFKFDIDKQ